MNGTQGNSRGERCGLKTRRLQRTPATGWWVVAALLGLLASVGAGLPAVASAQPLPGGSLYSEGDLEWEVVLDAEESWEYGSVGLPFVLHDEEAERLKMWYSTGSPGANPLAVFGGIAYAESLDGKEWTNRKAVFRADEQGGTNIGTFYPAVMKQNGQYFLYTMDYYIYHQGDWWSYISVRTSGDGFTFGSPTPITTPSDHEPWEDMYYIVLGAFGDPLTGGCRLFYNSVYQRPPPDWRRVMSSMTGSDGITWSGRTRAQGENGAFIEASQQVGNTPYQDRGRYRMLYVGLDEKLYRASSMDGVHWSGVQDAWTDALPLSKLLRNPPESLGHFLRAQFVRAPGGEEYLYFSYEVDAAQRRHRIARARLRPVLEIQAGARIEPATPTLEDDLVCVVEIEEPTPPMDLSLEYRWFRSGMEITTPIVLEGTALPITGPVLSHHYLRMGNSYFCRVEISGGGGWMTTRTQMVEFPFPPPPPGDVYSQGDLEWEVIMDVEYPWEYGVIGHPFILHDESDGKLKMWYNIGNQNAAVGGAWGGVAYAESVDGKHWTDRTLAVRGSDDGGTSVGLVWPVVMKKDGLFHLYASNYYQLYQNAYWNYLTVRTSTDGKSFGPPTLISTPADHEPWEDMYYAPLNVVSDPASGGYRMLYSVQYRRMPQTPRNYLASMVSPDGLHWEGRVRAQGSEGAFIHADYLRNVYLDGGLFRVLYAGLDGQLHRASSYDAVAWGGIQDGWNDARAMASILRNPPGDFRRGQFARLPGGSEYLYFSVYEPTPGQQIHQIARALLRPAVHVRADARIEPARPRTLDDLVCVVDIAEPTEASHLSTTFRWFKNNVALPNPVGVSGVFHVTSGPALSHQLTRKGDSFFCDVRISDGTSYVNLRTESVTIANSTPSMPVVRIVPENPQPWDGLGVEFLEYSVDPDGDPISYEIRWYRSTDGGHTFVYRVEVSGVVPQGSWVPPAFLRGGDVWRVEAIPFEIAQGKAGSGALAGEVRMDGETGFDQVFVGSNRRPVVVIESPLGGTLWANPQAQIRWRASDPDGDAVRVDLYALSEGGATALIATGLPAVGSLSWTPPTPAGGTGGAPGLDLDGDGLIAAGDLFRLALRWGEPSPYARSYRIFARAWDARNSTGFSTSSGSILVSAGVPADGAGLLEMAEKWHQRQ